MPFSFPYTHRPCFCLFCLQQYFQSLKECLVYWMKDWINEWMRLGPIYLSRMTSGKIICPFSEFFFFFTGSWGLVSTGWIQFYHFYYLQWIRFSNKVIFFNLCGVCWYCCYFICFNVTQIPSLEIRSTDWNSRRSWMFRMKFQQPKLCKRERINIKPGKFLYCVFKDSLAYNVHLC